jgi:CheY-like chemotaxis protein
MENFSGDVLVVNDVEINLVVARELLEKYKLRVDTANSGLEALEKIKYGISYDIIFMDILMPGMDGIQATQKIRELGYTGRIVALTGNFPDEISELGGIHGIFDGFVLNPIETDKLDDIINKLMPGIKTAGALQPKPGRLRIIRAFNRDVQKAIDTLHELLENYIEPCENIGAFTAVFHAMKTALANIGLADEAKLASALEKAGLNGEFKYVMELIEPFIRILEDLSRNVSEAIENALNSDDDDIDEDTELLRRQLTIIKNACDDYDIHKAESMFLIVLEQQLKNSTRLFVEEMRDLLYADSDFDGVHDSIEEFLTQNF